MPARSSYAPGTFCWADLSTTDAAASQRFFAGLLRGAPVAAVNEQHIHDSHWNSYVAVESADAVAARAEELGATLIERPMCLVGERLNGSEDPPRWSVFFAVHDLERAWAQAGELGGLELHEPLPAGPGNVITVADPAGATICLYAGEMDD